MQCPNCSKEMMADRLFCTWCEGYVPRPGTGTKAGVFRRAVATAIDPILIAAAFFLPPMIIGAIAGENLGMIVAVLMMVVVVVVNLRLFVRGMSFGKYVVGEQVVDRRTGRNPGFLKMFLREGIAKWVSGLFLGLGWFWAIWDKDGQAWHDKIAGTVVVNRREGRTPAAAAEGAPAEALAQ